MIIIIYGKGRDVFPWAATPSIPRGGPPAPPTGMGNSNLLLRGDQTIPASQKTKQNTLLLPNIERLSKLTDQQTQL